MEKLEITGAVRRGIRRAGNIVLQAELPAIAGDTPAAIHAKEMISALWEFAEQPLAENAGKALLLAAKEQRLFSFAPYKLTVTLDKKVHRRGILLTLTADLKANGAEHRTVRHFLWTTDEALRAQRIRLRARHEKTRKKV